MAKTNWNPIEVKALLISKFEKGNVVINTIEGLVSINLEDIIKQDIEGLLYDLNRDEITIFTLLNNDPKYINDYAICKIIRKLKENNEILINKLKLYE